MFLYHYVMSDNSAIINDQHNLAFNHLYRKYMNVDISYVPRTMCNITSMYISP